MRQYHSPNKTHTPWLTFAFPCRSQNRNLSTRQVRVNSRLYTLCRLLLSRLNSEKFVLWLASDFRYVHSDICLPNSRRKRYLIDIEKHQRPYNFSKRNFPRLFDTRFIRSQRYMRIHRYYRDFCVAHFEFTYYLLSISLLMNEQRFILTIPFYLNPDKNMPITECNFKRASQRFDNWLENSMWSRCYKLIINK